MEDDSQRQTAAKVLPFRKPAGDASAEGPYEDVISELIDAMQTGIRQAPWSQEHRDELAIYDAAVFRGRFGFSANKAFRQQAVSLLRRSDLTDVELKVLKDSGNLIAHDTDLVIKPPSRDGVIGLALTTLLVLIMLLVAMDLALATPVRSLRFVGLSGLLLVMAFTINAIHELFVWPQKIRRRLQAK